VKPKRPTGGKVKPGMTIAVGIYRRDSELASCINGTVASAPGSIVMRQTGCRLFGRWPGKKGRSRGTG